MKFPKPNIEVAPPSALRELDGELGTQTQEAYIAAVNSAPRLAGLAIRLNADRGAYHVSTPSSTRPSFVSLNPEREHYSNSLRSDIIKLRMAEFNAFYLSKGIAFGVNELVVTNLLHEMGHEYDFLSYIDQANGERAIASRLMSHAREAQLKQLPLGRATSRAIRARNANTDGYRDQLEAEGIDDAKWDELVKENVRAYTSLPCEKVADDFALNILATVEAS